MEVVTDPEIVLAPHARGDEPAPAAPTPPGGGGWSAERVAGAWLIAYRGHTLAAYRQDIRQWFDWCELFDTDPLDATRGLVQAWVAHLGSEQRAPATINRKISAVAGFYGYAEDEEIIRRSPIPADRRKLNLPKVHHAARLGYDRDQARALVRAARARSPRDGAIVLVLISAALRVSELCALNLADMAVWENRRTLTLHRKGGKAQTVRLVDDAATAVDAYLADRWSQPALLPELASVPATATPLFVTEAGGRLNRDQVAHIVRASARAAGLPELGPHDAARRTAITLMLDQGQPIRDVQVFAGHSSPTTTTIYDQGRDEIKRSPAVALDGLFT
jgi:site-specific recombinase XerD